MSTRTLEAVTVAQSGLETMQNGFLCCREQEVRRKKQENVKMLMSTLPRECHRDRLLTAATLAKLPAVYRHSSDTRSGLIKYQDMRYLLLSDIHANAVALTAVLKHAETKGWQEVIFLGDAVGYYPQPKEVVAALRALPLTAAILGNHDAILLEPAGGDAFRSVVIDVLAKQRTQLSSAEQTFLARLTRHALGETWEAVHSTLAGSWDYLDSLERAQSEPPLMSRPLLFFGHTHVPIIYLFAEHAGRNLTRSIPLTKDKTSYRIPPNARILFNPGSVGQPRDGIPLASYAVYDEDALTLEHYRVAFDISAVQGLVKTSDYPSSLGARLRKGR